MDISYLTDIQQWLQLYWREFTLALSSALLAFLLLRRWTRYLSNTRESREIKRIVKTLNKKALCNIAIPDGVGGFAHIDYLLPLDNAIVLITVQNYPGMIFGADNLTQWTQVYKHKSFKFENPTFYNKICKQAVKLYAPQSTVIGRVVFSSAADFPKGKPETISIVDELAKDIRHLIKSQKNNILLDDEWETLKAEALNAHKEAVKIMSH